MMLAAYPREAMNQETVGVWTRLIETFDYDETRKAVLRILATRYTFPTIADLRNEIIEARLELPSAERAYEMWLAYADRGGKLMVHPFVRQVANDAGFDLWTMRQSENPSILRSQFLKAYEERRRAAIREENLAELRGGPGYAAVEAPPAGEMAALGAAEGGHVGEAGPANDTDLGEAASEG